jgi:hypothetical protein
MPAAMAKHRRKVGNYSEMLRAKQVQSAKSFPLLIEKVPGRPDLISVGVNVAMAAPDVALYADYVHLKQVRDGVQILFGKLHPISDSQIQQAVEISFPYRAFINQLYKSVVGPRPGQPPFRESVQDAIKKFGYAPIGALPEPNDIKRVASFRANLVVMALHEDDAAIDFFHLDATTMQLVQASVAAGPVGQQSLGFKGVMRVVVSPTLLGYFLEMACDLAEKIMAANPAMTDAPIVEVAQ